MVNPQRNILFIPVLLLALLLLSSCSEEATQATLSPPPVEVDTITVTTEPVKLVAELAGRTSAYRIAEVRPQVGGIIQQRLFTEGAYVQAGDILYRIDPATYQAQFDSATAALAKARAVEHSARLKAERYKTLDRTNAVSEMDLVDIEAGWKQASADVASAEAALNSARISLDYTSVKAPISGRIGRSMISEGALVTAQQAAPLAIIQQLDPLYVDVTQSSNELLRLKKNLAADMQQEDGLSQVTIMLEDGSAYGRTGSLAFSDVTVDQSTGTVTLRAIVANPDEELLPGMFVRARISRGTKQDAILVPAASINRNLRGEAVVMLVNSESAVESRIIESGQNIGDRVLVTNGLKGGEKLIIAGFQKIRAGAPVKAVERRQSPDGQELAQKAPAQTSPAQAE